MRLVIDLGGDTDTVAAVAGGLAGAVFGMGGIPMRWASAVHGRVPGYGDRRGGLADLQELAAALDGKPLQHYYPGVIPRIGPTGGAAGHLGGEPRRRAVQRRRLRGHLAVPARRAVPARGAPDGLHRRQRLQHDLDAVLADVLDDMAALRAEGHRLLVHCHGGASRTGLVLRGWLMREKGMSVEEATAHVAERWPHLGLWNQSFTAALERLAARSDNNGGQR